MDIVIYHNPDCGTSRNVLGLIRNAGIEPHVIEYLKTPPARALLKQLIERMDVSVRSVLREKGTPYAELGLADPNLTDDQLARRDDGASDPDQSSDRGDARSASSCAARRRPCSIFCRRRSRANSTRKMASWSSIPAAGAWRQPERDLFMSIFERYLTLWVALCIVAGVVLGHFMPGAFHAIGTAEVAKVNLPVAALIWLMIMPMLIKIDFAALGQVKEHWRGIGVTLFINWAVKPFSMAALGWLFIGYLFRPYLPAGADRQLYRRA